MTSITITFTATEVRTLRTLVEDAQRAQRKRATFLRSRPSTRARNALRTLRTLQRRTDALLDRVQPFADALDAATIAQLRSEAGVR